MGIVFNSKGIKHPQFGKMDCLCGLVSDVDRYGFLMKIHEPACFVAIKCWHSLNLAL